MITTDRLNKRLTICFLVVLSLVFLPNLVLAAVDVYAEGAYTNTDLKIYLYADITTEPILSFGVKVSYPAGLTYASFTKNNAVWYFGAGGADYPYMDPEDDGSGVIFIGGKLDTNNPTAGVSVGNRVLLGTLTFTHAGVTDFSGVTLALGRGGDYANFVQTDGVVLDSGVGFSIEIHERGDANGDGIVNFQDMLFIRAYTETGGNYTPYADCNDDLQINFQDMLCVRAKTE